MSMGRPSGVKETQPRRRMNRGVPDSEAYRYEDSGCSKATAELGSQSLCLECPFEICTLIKKAGGL